MSPNNISMLPPKYCKTFADSVPAPLHSYKLCRPDPALEKQQIKAILKRSKPKKFWSPKRLSEFQKKSVRIRSVACESCLRPLIPAGRGYGEKVWYGEKGLWSETNPRAGLASAQAPLLDWAGPAQHLPLLLPPFLIICLNKGGWAHRIAVIQRLDKSQNWPILKYFHLSKAEDFSRDKFVWCQRFTQPCLKSSFYDFFLLLP